MLDTPCSEVVWRVLATHCIRQFPLHFPSVRHRVPSHFNCSLMLDTPCSEVVWRVLATHSIRQFPLHFLSRASPCAITFQLESTLCTLVTYQLFTYCTPRLPVTYFALYQIRFACSYCTVLYRYRLTVGPKLWCDVQQWMYRVRINYRRILKNHIFTNTEQKYMMLLPFERGMFAVS